MLMPDAFEICWVYDLVAPERPGKYFSRYGHRVIVSPADCRIAASELGQGATDIVFNARRRGSGKDVEYHLSFERSVAA